MKKTFHEDCIAFTKASDWLHEHSFISFAKGDNRKRRRMERTIKTLSRRISIASPEWGWLNMSNNIRINCNKGIDNICK